MFPYLHHLDGQEPAQSILDDAVEPAILLAVREGHKVIPAVDKLGLLRRKGFVTLDPGDEGFGVSGRGRFERGVHPDPVHQLICKDSL